MKRFFIALGTVAAGVTMLADHHYATLGTFGNDLLLSDVKGFKVVNTDTIRSWVNSAGEVRDTLYVGRRPVFVTADGTEHKPTFEYAFSHKTVKEGLHHPFMYNVMYDTDKTFAVEVEGDGLKSDNPDGGVYPLQNDYLWIVDLYGDNKKEKWVKEKGKVKVRVTCRYCNPNYGVAMAKSEWPSAFAYERETDATGKDWDVFEMPPSPVVLNAGHEECCYYTVKRDAEYLMTLPYCQNEFTTDPNRNLFSNGEASIMKTYGDLFGVDYIPSAQLVPANYLSIHKDGAWEDAHIIPHGAWRYYYGVISGTYGTGGSNYDYFNINTTLRRMDTLLAKSPELKQEMDGYKARLLTIRANGYLRLLQIYGPRWEDSDSGNELVCPLVTEKQGDMNNRSSMKDVLGQIYADLDEALSLYETSKTERRSISDVDASVAHVVYARAAMLSHDWATADRHSSAIMSSYEIMPAGDYLKGFAVPSCEWIWGTPESPESTYYMAHGSYYSQNGPYPGIWNITTGAMNYSLFKLMDEKDIRRNCYFMPENVGQTYEDWCSEDLYVSGKNNYIFSDQRRGVHFRAMYFKNNLEPLGKFSLTSNAPIDFGSQMKFWSLDEFGSGSFPMMRASEMYLTNAEAALERGDVAKAREALTKVCANRIEGYTAPQSVEGLRDEIRNQRRLELWGEGHSWFDMKRWNGTFGNQLMYDGGNVPATHQLNLTPDWMNGWRYVMPAIK